MKAHETSDYRASVWPMPVYPNKADGTARRLGIEFEFIGLELDTVSRCVSDIFGGTLDPISEYECVIRETRCGDFGVELDFRYLKKRGRERAASEEKSDSLEDMAEGVIALVAKRLVPVEIVGPPMPMDQLWQLEELIRQLRMIGAKGTRDSTHFAFGLHLNPELPSLEADSVNGYLKAFLCLYPWLMTRSDVDFTRRVTPYIDPFTEDYLKLVLAADYWPDTSTLIDDYLQLNPTRNRALDMLPLFTHLDQERVRRKVSDPRVKSRPTLHYRLPNCQIDEPGWALAQPWRDWLQVEALAARTDVLAKACEASHARVGSWTEPLFGRWSHAASDWVLPELL